MSYKVFDIEVPADGGAFLRNGHSRVTALLMGVTGPYNAGVWVRNSRGEITTGHIWVRPDELALICQQFVVRYSDLFPEREGPLLNLIRLAVELVETGTATAVYRYQLLEIIGQLYPDYCPACATQGETHPMVACLAER